MAGLVTVVGFAVPTWLCGAVILPVVLADAGIRWSLASALGAALAALAGMWGYGFATGPAAPSPSQAPSPTPMPPPTPDPAMSSGPPAPVVQARGARSIAIGGSNSGDIGTGDRSTAGGAGEATDPGPDPVPGPGPDPDPAAAPGPARRPAEPGREGGRGTVAAEGQRSIAVGGDNSGRLSTGDDPGGNRP
ncbi:hypothetical protein [Streptomyces sp. NPDC097619]|uniref:hypothetical protein n=1 Tax=Streptomyces sp. NPDC097619 TaxID=3157228 RepID=UPI0033336473